MKIRTKFDALASQYGEKAAAVTQQALAQTAEFVAAIPTRTRGAIKGVSKLAASAEPIVAPLVDAQLETLEVVTTQSAKRLKAASEAESFDGLVKAQVALFPETRAAALSETRKYLELYFTAKEKVDAKVKAKVLGWVTPKAPKARKATATPAPVAA